MKQGRSMGGSGQYDHDRAALLRRLSAASAVDLAIIGGGATGLGLALDAALRGLSVVLLEAGDFSQGTSSRATKLVHGGVRYLAQGNLSLVREALRERAILLANAPHLAAPLPFVMPAYRHWERLFYGSGLKMYDWMAGSAGLGRTQWLNADATLERLPGLSREGLRGGILYWDAQFDDAGVAIALARTAAEQGALLLNYCPVVSLLHDGRGRVSGLVCRDVETEQRFELTAGCVVNATGVWVDEVRSLDVAGSPAALPPMVTVSQGAHVVLDEDFLPGQHALLVPRTRDGRVLFAVPWMGKIVVGTTDMPQPGPSGRPQASAAELGFILAEAGRYLAKTPGPSDVRSRWAGLRPLARPPVVKGRGTGGISREHTVEVAATGLVSVAGGKWTTYRAMAEDILRRCMQAGLLDDLPPAATMHRALIGSPDVAASPGALAVSPGLDRYGTEAAVLRAAPESAERLGPGLTVAMVRHAARHAYARRVEDVLARRSRLLFLDAAAAIEAAPGVARVLAMETGADPFLEDFLRLARADYLSI